MGKMINQIDEMIDELAKELVDLLNEWTKNAEYNLPNLLETSKRVEKIKYQIEALQRLKKKLGEK